MIRGCRRFQRVGFTFFVLLILSFSFPPAPINASFLDDLARDTWNYLGSDWARSQHLPWSWRSTDPNLLGGEYCNPAEIGLLTLSYLAAFDLNRSWGPEWSTAEEEVMAILNQLIAWQTGTQSTQPHGPNSYHNLFFQWYWINETQWSPPVVGDANGDNQVVPSVDNAWLAACLVTIKEYAIFHNHLELQEKAGEILDRLDFSAWYDFDTNFFYWGGLNNPKSGGICDYYSNENRITNFMARALGDLTFVEFRESINALQKPAGVYGAIQVDRMAYDGSIFTYFAPGLFILEKGLSYDRDTLSPVVEAQIQYAADQGYEAWGISDCFGVAGDGYAEQGAPPVASPNSPEGFLGLVTPHASVLALNSSFGAQAVNNLEGSALN